jgi:hypothetical protein
VANKSENFDTFFNKFEADSATQLSRIDFPLKNIVKSTDGETPDTIKTMLRSDWKYSNFKHIKYLITKKIFINKTQMEVLFQIEETGVEVHYYFVNTNGYWRLHSITDDSD